MKNNAFRSAVASLARRLTGPIVFRKPLPARFGGTSLHVTSRADLRLLYPGFTRSANDLLTVADRYIQAGSAVWDIGSNLGIFAFCAAWKTGPSGRVFTVEADPKYAELQNRTIAQLPTGYGRVSTLCAAVADRTGVLELSIPKNGHARNHLSLVAGNDAAETESTKSVVSVTLDWLLEHWPEPAFVKMDVEGAELLALKGATRMLAGVRPSFYLETSAVTRDEVTNLLRSYGYRFFRLEHGAQVPTQACHFETVAIPGERA